MNVHPKVVAGTIAGAVTIILVWAASLASIQIPPEVASAITTLLSAIAAWAQPDGGTIS